MARVKQDDKKTVTIIFMINIEWANTYFNIKNKTNGGNENRRRRELINNVYK